MEFPGRCCQSLDQFIKQVPGFIVNVSVKSVGLYVEVGSWWSANEISEKQLSGILPAL